jgi:hypothetical protein
LYCFLLHQLAEDLKKSLARDVGRYTTRHVMSGLAKIKHTEKGEKTQIDTPSAMVQSQENQNNGWRKLIFCSSEINVL